MTFAELLERYCAGQLPVGPAFLFLAATDQVILLSIEQNSQEVSASEECRAAGTDSNAPAKPT